MNKKQLQKIIQEELEKMLEDTDGISQDNVMDEELIEEGFWSNIFRAAGLAALGFALSSSPAEAADIKVTSRTGDTRFVHRDNKPGEDDAVTFQKFQAALQKTDAATAQGLEASLVSPYYKIQIGDNAPFALEGDGYDIVKIKNGVQREAGGQTVSVFAIDKKEYNSIESSHIQKGQDLVKMVQAASTIEWPLPHEVLDGKSPVLTLDTTKLNKDLVDKLKSKDPSVIASFIQAELSEKGKNKIWKMKSQFDGEVIGPVGKVMMIPLKGFIEPIKKGVKENKLNKQTLKEMVEECMNDMLQGGGEALPPKQPSGPVSNIDPDGYEGEMAKGNLFNAAKAATSLHNLFGDQENLEPWVEEKIAIASNMLKTVADYVEYQKTKGTR